MKKIILNYSSFRISMLFGVFLVLSSVSTSAQSTSGKVTDTNNEILIGVNVLEKGTNNSCTTNANGIFKINLTKEGGILIVSYVGYDSKEVNASANMSIVLKEGNALKEVVVTSENRSTSVQNVPIAIELISGKAIQKQGLTDLTQLVALAPGLQYQANNVFSSFTIRGIGSHDGEAELGDQAITVGIDGEYINRPIALGAAMFDISRVEVLKGPQGTLKGRNSTGGAVSIITNKPKNIFEADASANIGNYGTTNFTGMVNVPLSKSVAVRTAAMFSKHDGYRDGGPAGRVDDGNVFGGRITVGFKPSTAFSLNVTSEYAKVDQGAPAQYGVPLSGSVPDGDAPSDFVVDIPDNFDLATKGFVKSNQYANRVNAQYNFGKASLSYNGSYRNVNFDSYQPLNGFLPEIFTFDNHFNIGTQNHELRINVDGEKLIYQVGLFYGDEKQNAARGLILPIASGGFGGQIPYLFFALRDVKSTTSAVFAQATYNFTKNLSMTGGLRNTTDKKSQEAADANGFVFFYPNYPTSMTQENVNKNVVISKGVQWNQSTWLLGLDYKVTNKSLLYSKISTGYKSGGFDNYSVYSPEKLTAYEIGSKNKFMDDRLRLNVSVFHYDYKDQQVSVFISSTIGGAIQNAGSTKVNGVELEGELLASKSDKFQFTVNYLDAIFGDFKTRMNVVNAAPVDVDLMGNRPSQAPKWTLVGGYEHNFNLKKGDIKFGIRSTYKSEYFMTAFNWAGDKQKAFTKTDANLTYSNKNCNWDLGVYIQNMEDNRILNYANFTGDTVNIYNFIMGSPRTFGIQFNYHFSGKSKK